MNAPPSSAVCGIDELPMRAELRWTSQGSLAFEVTGVLKKTDLSTTSLNVPPPNASIAALPFPVAGVAPMLAPPELTALRSAAVEPAGAPPSPPSPPGSLPTADLAVTNASETLRVLYIDGVPAVWAAPGATGPVRGLVHGRYVTQWRTFLGDQLDPPITQTVPATPATDAGASK
jgi:hypothetical protein